MDYTPFFGALVEIDEDIAAEHGIHPAYENDLLLVHQVEPPEMAHGAHVVLHPIAPVGLHEMPAPYVFGGGPERGVSVNP